MQNCFLTNTSLTITKFNINFGRMPSLQHPCASSTLRTKNCFMSYPHTLKQIEKVRLGIQNRNIFTKYRSGDMATIVTGFIWEKPHRQIPSVSNPGIQACSFSGKTLLFTRMAALDKSLPPSSVLTAPSCPHFYVTCNSDKNEFCPTLLVRLNVITLKHISTYTET